MAKLKLSAIANDKSVKLTVELPAAVHRDLLAYAEVLARENRTNLRPVSFMDPLPPLAADRSPCLSAPAGPPASGSLLRPCPAQEYETPARHR
jgi:hypothetical protein